MQNNRGFTLVELMLAMALLSFVLAIVSVGFLQIGKIYQSGVASRNTQQVSRRIMEDIAREVRSATAIIVPVNTSTDNELCLEANSSFVRYQRTTDGTFKKAIYSGGDCTSAIPGGATVTLLIDPSLNNNHGLKARKFTTKPIKDASNASGSVEVNLVVTTGADDLVNSDNTCKPGDAGSQFCATTSLTNTISIRGINND